MSNYNWNEIFKGKDEKELVRIYSGDSHLDFEAEIYAGIELQNRNFDFSMIQQVHKRKTDQLASEIEELEKITFRNSKFYQKQVTSGIGFFFLILFVALNFNHLKTEGMGKIWKAGIYLGVLLFGFLFARWSFQRYLSGKQKRLEEKKVLLAKLNMNN
jgi:hypothetical protein